MPLCPTTCKVPQNHNFFLQVNNLINLLNRKLEIRHPRLFLSDDDGLVVLPDRLRPAPPIDFIPPTPLRPIFRLIEQGTVRLTLLQPSQDLEAGIQCSLLHTSLADCANDIVDHYVALSYVWGDQNDRRTISVDGKRLDITSSLDSALRHIRDSHRILRVWADGVCISQNGIDILDRSTHDHLPRSIISSMQVCHGVYGLSKTIVCAQTWS